MKTIYKTTIAGILGVITLASPLSTFAANNTIKDRGNFCASIDATGQKILAQIDTKSGNFNNKKENRMKQMGDKRMSRDTKRTEFRGNRDVKHDTRYDAFLGKADTDAKKTAVANFKTATESAITKRRNAIDTAVATFRTGVDALINSKGGALDTSITTLKNSINDAISKAKASCASSVSDATVRQTFRASIKVAHDVFKNTKEDTNIKAKLQVLVDARKSAVENAVATFKTEMEKARADLKAVFGN